MVRRLILLSSLLALPLLADEAWPQATARPDLTGSLLPAFWEATQAMTVPLPADGAELNMLLWPTEGAAAALLDANRQAQLEVRFERYGDALLVAVYLSRHGKGDFVYLKAGRDTRLPLATWTAGRDHWGRLRIAWSSTDSGVELTMSWQGKVETLKFPNAALTPCSHVFLPAKLRFAHLGFVPDNTPVYPGGL